MRNRLQNNIIILSIITLIILVLVVISIDFLNKNERKIFTVNKINQKIYEVPQNREVVNLVSTELKNFLISNLKKPKEERKSIHNYYLKLELNDDTYIKPSEETEIYKDEMEKITAINIREYDEKINIENLTGL